MIQPTEALFSAGRYLRDNPGEVFRAARNALGLRFGVPLDLFRWLAEKAEAEGKIQNVILEPKAPGLAFSGTIDAMGTSVRAEATLFFEHLNLDDRELRVELRIEDVDLKLTEPSASSVAMLIKSGALDLSKPGNLVKHLPNRPEMLVDAFDNRVVLDLMRHPKIEKNESLRTVVALVTSVFTMHGIEVGSSHMDMSFRALPKGLFHAAKHIRRGVLKPGLSRVRRLLPG